LFSTAIGHDFSSERSDTAYIFVDFGLMNGLGFGCHMVGFQLKEPPLGFYSSCESAELMAGSHYAVARKKDADAVAPHRHANGSGALGVAYAGGKLLVGDGCSVGYCQQSVPHFALKISTNGEQWKLKRVASVGEIFVKQPCRSLRSG